MDTSNAYQIALREHYTAAWGRLNATRLWHRGPVLPQTCRVFEFAPSDKTFSWVYATCGLTPFIESEVLEMFLLSPSDSDAHVELLTAIAHYHQTGARLGLGHTVTFGRPWLENSLCEFGLISLPYPFGPSLEHAVIAGKRTRVLWLLPITATERALKVSSGLAALEELFEQKQFNYLDPHRTSVA